ncbi:MAG: gamma-glutamyltransferase [Burkholderiales bacterium]|nr:gamma-glutamyltransferase [Burkholderiales bacterium]
MNGTVVAPQPEAVDAGAEMLRGGGNAVDAAVCTALVQAVVDPLMCGIAGFGTMQVWSPAFGPVSIDFHAESGSRSREDMWMADLIGESADGYTQRLAGDVNELGYGSIATPGTLKGLALALHLHGTRTFAEAVAPAIAWAREGFAVRPFMHSAWIHDEDAAGALPLLRKLDYSAAGRRLFFRDDGSLKRPGDRIRNPEFADTLERLARAGPDDFYSGETAAVIAQDFARGGALVTGGDLRDYAVDVAQPLTGRYRGLRVCSAPLPAGGAHLILALNVLDHFDLRALEHNSPDYIECVSAVMAITQEARRTLGDPRFIDVPLAYLLGAEHAAALATRVRRRPRTGGSPATPAEHPHTTQVCSADAAGNVVSLTHSLGTPSGVITAGLGFMYNGAMSVFDPRPGTPQSIAPGKRRYTAIAPALVTRDGVPLLAIGAPGGAHITNALVQGIVNVLDFGMTIGEAVAAPRFSLIGGAIHVSNRIPWQTTRELERRGHRVVRSHQSYAFAGLHGLLREADGRWRGGADPQRDGMALEV